MSTLAKIFLAIGAVVLFGIVSLCLLFMHERSAYAATAVPFIQKIVPEFAAQWDPEVLKNHTAPQILAHVSSEDFEKLAVKYRRLGALKILGTPVFTQVWTDTNNGTIIAYTVPATFETGDARITIRLLDSTNGFQI